MSVNGGPARIPEDLFAGHIAESDTLSRVPLGTKLIPVVGISAGNIPAWRAAGAAGFGLWSYLFRPGDEVPTVQQKASALVAAYRAGASA
jgi:2-keto-3-deoxy-6-phosphogluconate aldolase